MDRTPILGLMVTELTDDPAFADWRRDLAGDSPDSNMVIIDAAFGEIAGWIDPIGSAPLTWGMLKYGLNYNGD